MPLALRRQLVKREEGALDESLPATSAPDSDQDPDISDLNENSCKASDLAKGKHRLASSSKAEDDASELPVTITMRSLWVAMSCTKEPEGLRRDALGAADPLSGILLGQKHSLQGIDATLCLD